MQGQQKIHITKHAIERLRQRWLALYGFAAPFHASQFLRSMLAGSKLARIAEGVAYYSNCGFLLVVRDNTLITVIIELNKYRHLNAIAA